MTVEELYKSVTKYLSGQVESPALDSRLLIESQLNLDNTQFILKSGMGISEEDQKAIIKNVEKRKSGIPIAYLTNKRDFFGHSFYVEEGVLIPQPDTETLVEEALRSIKTNFCSKPISILDLCSGTGCVGISLAYEAQTVCKEVELTLSDISETAFKVFEKNSQTILNNSKVKINKCLGNMFETVNGRKFSLIVSNPPYIKTQVIPSLPKEVKSEPLLALDGGIDGLDFVREIAKEAKNYLCEGGFLFIEIGYDQGQDCLDLFKNSGYSHVSITKDLGGNDRVVSCRL